jgi:hypothetical protein
LSLRPMRGRSPRPSRGRPCQPRSTEKSTRRGCGLQSD